MPNNKFSKEEAIESNKEVLVEVESADEENFEGQDGVVRSTDEEPVTALDGFTDVAIGLCRSGEGFKVVKIPYNNVTLETGALEILESELIDRTHAEEAFKINVVRERIFGGV